MLVDISTTALMILATTILHIAGISFVVMNIRSHVEHGGIAIQLSGHEKQVKWLC